MIFLTFAFIFILSIAVPSVAGYVLLTGSKQIDRIKYPTIARAQRILRSRDTKAREKESKEIQQKHAEITMTALRVTENKSKDMLMQVKTDHKELVAFWDGLYGELMYKENEAKRLESERLNAIEQEGYLVQHRKELDEWNKHEKERVAKYKQQRQLEIYTEQKEKRELEAFYESRQSVHTYADSSYGDRIVKVHAVNLRKTPTLAARKVGGLVQYQKVSVDGWKESEEQYGNNIWFRLKASPVHPSGWIWSGSLNNISTSGLANLNEDYETVTYRDFNGRSVTTHVSKES